MSGVQDLDISPRTLGRGHPWGQPCHSGVGGSSEALESDGPAFKSQLHTYQLGDPGQVTLLLRVSYFLVVKWG